MSRPPSPAGSLPHAADAESVFRAVLGDAFDALPPAVRALHSVDGHARFVGRAGIHRGTHPLAVLCAICTRLPPSGDDVAVMIDFEADAGGETWRRQFDRARMTSHLRAQDGVLVERLGLLQFRFALSVHDGAVRWRTVGARLLGVLPLPTAWFAQVRCIESERNGRYHFLAEAALPLIGRVMRYEGWLAPV